MNRRLGPSAARVDRQLTRAADAIAEQSGVRPELPGRGPGAPGEPFWDLDGEVLVYALRAERPDEDDAPGADDAEDLVWRWTTDSPGTLAFWAMRDVTFRMAGSRQEWAALLGAAAPEWRARHEAWLHASDNSGFLGWPNPAEVVAVIDRLAADLAARAGQPHGYLPGTRPRDDAQPWIETHGDELNYRVRAGDRDLRDDRTTDISDLLFWVFEPVTREMARAGTSPGGDWRTRWLELMILVNPAWEARVREFL